MQPTPADLHSSSGSGFFAEWCRRCAAIGLPRSRIASGLGVRPGTIDKWCAPSAETDPTGRVLTVLRSDLPLGARRELVRMLCELVGVQPVEPEDASLDTDPLGVQVCQIGERFGGLCAEAGAAMAGDGVIDHNERDRLLGRLASIRREVAELETALQQGA